MAAARCNDAVPAVSGQLAPKGQRKPVRQHRAILPTTLGQTLAGRAASERGMEVQP